MDYTEIVRNNLFSPTYESRQDFIGNICNKEGQEIGICYYSDDDEYYVFIEDENILVTKSLTSAITKFLSII